MARYRVPPGARVLVREPYRLYEAGEEFDAPKDYLPGRRLIPLDQEAADALAKIGVKATAQVSATVAAPAPKVAVEIEEKPAGSVRRASDKQL